MNVALTTGKGRVLAGLAFAMTISTGSAFAQCTSVATGPGAPLFGPQFTAIAATGGAASGAFAGALGNLRAALLAHAAGACASPLIRAKHGRPVGGSAV